MKFASTVLVSSLFGLLAGAQPAFERRNYNEVNANYVVETAYATVTAAAAPVAAKAGNVVVVTVTDTVTGGHVVAQAAPTSSAAVAAPVAHAAVYSKAPQPTTTQAAATQAPATQAPATQAPATTSAAPAQQTSSSDWQNEMLGQLNAIRAAAGKPSVSLNQAVSSIAQEHSTYQSRARSMTHADGSGSLGTRYSAAGLNWQGAAENIAWNQKTVSDVMTAWKNSAGHYANMIGDYNYVGFGVANLYWTQDFLKA
ncbi:hypothetical protein IWW55_001585 [Coemansia sp. RSA 2706]|nr:hypothetical protein LPJ70_006450 [Coemansia sp. RSA 2708]KAJ2306148.1 hypothetical protein IWW55_001585 [Coemansia sp. RSA 2706]KAJ2327971.1 hypothetical protein IWW51_001450 [Coemansia sp. RSA 2702]